MYEELDRPRKIGHFLMKCEHIKESLIEAAGGKLPAEAAAHVQT